MLPSADLNAASQRVGLGRLLLACFGSQRLESGEPLSPSFLNAVLLSQELWRREKTLSGGQHYGHRASNVPDSDVVNKAPCRVHVGFHAGISLQGFM